MDERHIISEWLRVKANRDTIPTIGYSKEIAEHIKATATCFYFSDGDIVYKTGSNYYKLKTIDNQ